MKKRNYKKVIKLLGLIYRVENKTSISKKEQMEGIRVRDFNNSKGIFKIMKKSKDWKSYKFKTFIDDPSNFWATYKVKEDDIDLTIEFQPARSDSDKYRVYFKLIEKKGKLTFKEI